VGSGKKCDCIVGSPDRSVSRRHAELRCSVTDQGRPAVWVKDAGSLNGTFVNGEKLTEERLLKAGDVVTFADVSYRLKVDLW
jgi:pSer/pThr/pTyr-binding forkhead associated (FHA) protein